MSSSGITSSRNRQIPQAVEYYRACRSDYDLLGEQLRDHLMNDVRLKGLIHSSKYRSKDPDHLMDKLIRMEIVRLAKKPRPKPITKSNIKDKIWDLAGVRLLHLHTLQMAEIDPVIREVLKTYNYTLLEDPFVCIWDIENRTFFEGLGFRTEERPEMYTSVHYAVSPANRPEMRAEIQVRTLMEELWGEVSHSIDYPKPSENENCRDQLKVLARLASASSRLVDSIFAAHQSGEQSIIPSEE